MAGPTAAGASLGHVGGDDFLFLMDADTHRRHGRPRFVTTFDRIISTFYDETGKAGGIVALDRSGE